MRVKVTPFVLRTFPPIKYRGNTHPEKATNL